MTFFDKKTEVMKVELTPFGRYKLSVGKLKPHHYRFFDNNVVYDGKAILISEAQNEADKRIRHETPVLKQNPNITGVESGISILETDELKVQMHFSASAAEIKYLQNDRQNKRDDHINQMVYNLGTVEYDAEQSPSIQVDAFRGKIANTTDKFYASINIQTASIPQIDMSITYNAKVTNSFMDVVSNQSDITTVGPFPDGSRIIIEKQDPLIRIKETNAFDEKDNFRINAYKVYTERGVADGRLLYEKLNFEKKEKKIVSDLFVETEENQDIVFSPREVPYFFNILVDKEIAEEDYCKTIGDLKIKNIYLDHEIICPDQEIEQLNIYASPVTSDDLEDCD